MAEARPQRPAAAALSLHGVGRRHGASVVLDDVSLALAPGERLALIGPNGAGKTTLFDIVSGELAPSAGDVRLDGRSIAGRSPQQVRRLGLARSHQISRLFVGLTVREHLRCAALGTRPQRHALWWRRAVRAAVEAEADALLHRLGLADWADEPVATLSYARQRLLDLALALAAEPRVLLLDEPSSGLSRDETRALMALLRRETEGRTLLLVEHDMDLVFDLADRVAVLAGGRLIACGPAARVRVDPAVQAAYLGAVGLDAARAADRSAPC